VKPKNLEMFVPGHFLEPSGLVRLSGIGAPGPPQAPAREAELVRGILGAGPAVAIASPPSFFDQVHVFMTHQELFNYMEATKAYALLGAALEKTVDDIVDLIKDIPFYPAMRYAASLQKVVGFRGRDPDVQRLLLHSVYGGVIGEGGECFLRAHANGVVIFEQQLFALQRLLVLHASEEEADGLTPQQEAHLKMALLYIPGTLLGPDDDVTEAPEYVADERWLRYFVGNGGFVAHGSLMHELARAHRMYEVLAKSRLVRDHHDFCPLEEWLLEAYRMTFVELQAFGFVMLAGSKLQLDDERQVAILPDYFNNTAFESRTEDGFSAFAADRTWLREQFQRSTETPRRIAFETHPFLRRPGLIQNDGSILITAPRAIHGWLGTSGTYYRVFNLVREDDELREKFTRFNGLLQEHCARHLMHVAHPDKSRYATIKAAGTVYGPRTYRRRKGEDNLETSDVAVDLILDLVLFEVTASRLTERSLVEADAESVLADLEKMVIKKMRQLGRVIGDVFDVPSRFPEVDLALVERVWPIVVSGDGLFQNPSLWEYANEKAGKRFKFDRVDATVKPVVILDLEEIEILYGMIASGISLVEILEMKTSDLWKHRDFKAMADAAFSHRWNGQPKFVADEYARASRAIRDAIGLRQDPNGPVLEKPKAA
jgi:hypothetical protein